MVAEKTMEEILSGEEEPSEHNARGRRRQEPPSTVPTRVCLFTKEKSSEVPSDIPPITSDG